MMHLHTSVKAKRELSRQGRLRKGDKRYDRLGPKLVSPRILIIKGSNFLKSLYFYITNIINIINKIENDSKIFDMHIVLFSSRNIQNITD